MKTPDRELQLMARMLLAAKKRGDPDYDAYLREICAAHNREPVSVEVDIERLAAQYWVPG